MHCPRESSRENSTSLYFTFMAPRNPPRVRRTFFAKSPLVFILSRRRSADLRAGIRSAGNDLPSGASRETTVNAFDSASCVILDSRTVLPTPRSPTKSSPLNERPFLHLSKAISALVMISSRPASWGGIVPAPGA